MLHIRSAVKRVSYMYELAGEAYTVLCHRKGRDRMTG